MQGILSLKLSPLILVMSMQKMKMLLKLNMIMIWLTAETHWSVSGQVFFSVWFSPPHELSSLVHNQFFCTKDSRKCGFQVKHDFPALCVKRPASSSRQPHIHKPKRESFTGDPIYFTVYTMLQNHPKISHLNSQICQIAPLRPKPLELWSWDFARVIYSLFGRFRKIEKKSRFFDIFWKDKIFLVVRFFCKVNFVINVDWNHLIYDVLVIWKISQNRNKKKINFLKFFWLKNFWLQNFSA